MKIRRYVGKDTQEAIAKVKRDLGSEALILNTKKVRQKKGFFWFLSKPMIEVLAAVDEKPSQPQKVAEVEMKRTQKSISEEKVDKLEAKVGSLEKMLDKIYHAVEGTKLQNTNKEEDQQDYFSILKKNLLNNDVTPELVDKIILQAKEKVKNIANINEAASAVYSVLTSILGQVSPLNVGNPGEQKIIMFVGPTGVGKTTTLAKIAANYALGEGKKVGLLTSDTYRISAVDQLKTYSEILGIPLSVIYSAEDIPKLIEQYGDKDLILIDTAGRSHKDSTQFEEIKAILDVLPEVEVFLVLSSVTNDKAIAEIAKNYNFIKNCKLIITKIDEAVSNAMVINAKAITEMPLSYLTNGQSVPDDIEIVDIDKIIKNLMGSIA